MCGICGYYGNFGSPDFLIKMAQSIAHRGPDANGAVFIDSIDVNADCPLHEWRNFKNNETNVMLNRRCDLGLAHTRLSIIDLSVSGHQPMWGKDGAQVIVYNGELYNFKQLKAELETDGYFFKSGSDTEVILKAYEKYGCDCLKYLNGIFAFALWDNDRKYLFLARDGLGVKPLYYTFSSNGFAFASELKSLLSVPGFRPTINIHSVVNYATYLWCPAPQTPFEEVQKLEPGQAMIVHNGQKKEQWYHYKLPIGKTKTFISRKKAAHEVRRLVRQAVKRQMIADVEVGAFLSGGLDSSAVVAFAKEFNPGRLKCFTIDSQHNESGSQEILDDLPYAKRVADYLNVDLNVIKVGPEIISCLEKMIYHLDEPLADPAPLNVLLISQLARKQGIKVLLSGSGGDDIFTGYRRHYALTQEKYWSWLPLTIRRLMAGVARHIPVSSQFSRRISKAFQYADLEKDYRLVSYFYWINPELVCEVLAPAIKSQMVDYNVAMPLLRSLDSFFGEKINPLDKMLYLEARYFLADHNLNYTDKMGMAEGVEIRVPLLDPDLVEFVSALPVEYKQRGHIGKWIFKKSMEKILPNDVIYRPKSGFGMPLRRWLRHELKDIVDDVLSTESLKRRGLLDPEGVQHLRKMDETGKIDVVYPIFSMVCMELWCRIFIDRKGAL